MGPRTTITDSATNQSLIRVSLFYLSKVNGKAIDETRRATNRASAVGPLNVQIVSREVPAVPSTFTIVGRTHFVTEVHELFSTAYEVAGDVSFAPRPNRIYVVVGMLGERYSAVWIQDSQSGEVMGNKIERTSER